MPIVYFLYVASAVLVISTLTEPNRSTDTLTGAFFLGLIGAIVHVCLPAFEVAS